MAPVCSGIWALPRIKTLESRYPLPCPQELVMHSENYQGQLAPAKATKAETAASFPSCALSLPSPSPVRSHAQTLTHSHPCTARLHAHTPLVSATYPRTSSCRSVRDRACSAFISRSLCVSRRIRVARRFASPGTKLQWGSATGISSGNRERGCSGYGRGNDRLIKRSVTTQEQQRTLASLSC